MAVRCQLVNADEVAICDEFDSAGVEDSGGCSGWLATERRSGVLTASARRSKFARQVSGAYGNSGQCDLQLFLNDHAEPIPHVDERGDDGGAIGCGEDEANRICFTADAERMNLE
jgi:hypothetical protein